MKLARQSKICNSRFLQNILLSNNLNCFVDLSLFIFLDCFVILRIPRNDGGGAHCFIIGANERISNGVFGLLNSRNGKKGNMHFMRAWLAWKFFWIASSLHSSQ
jgi:hypothetical protein